MKRLLKLNKTSWLILILAGVLFSSYSPKSGITNRIRVNTLEGRSISYYLNHPKIDKVTKLFYQGEYAISTDLSNCTFLDSLLTENDETRPFYFFVFNSLVNSSNSIEGKLADNCLLYIEKYPCQFFTALNSADFDINVVKWTNSVGIKLSNPQTYQQFKLKVDSKMVGCNENADLWSSFFSEARKSRVR